MKKFPVLISGTNGSCKRSVTISQIEVLFIIAALVKIEEHRKYFNITMTFYGGEFNKSVKCKRIPNGYLSKFTIKLT